MKKVKLKQFINEINLVLEQEGMNPLPDLYKHMVLAIFRKGPRTEKRFLDSLNAAFLFLLKRGHIAPKSTINNMSLTATGQRLNARHASEPQDKSRTFDSAMNVIKQK